MQRALLILLALSCLPAAPVRAQADLDDWGCGTVLTPEGVAYARKKLADGSWTQRPPQGRDLPTICIGISCHIVRYSDGSGGIPESRVDTAIGDLNQHTANASMFFFRSGDFIYVDSDEFAELDTGAERDALRQHDPVDGTINVWFVPVLTGLCGESSFTFSQHQGIMMANDCTATSSDHATFSHEVGHYFDLFHTHEPFFGNECVDGSNCVDAGDLICDTPADPGLFGEVDGACNYIGTDLDACGSGLPYSPSIENLMNYAPQRCTNEFTVDQFTRARAVALGERDDHIVPCNFSEPGACCVNGNCIEVAAAGLCFPLGGFYMGAGTSCDDEEVICDLPGSPGACCTNTNCTDVDSVVECDTLGGIYVGYGTSCGGITCDTFSPGACCDGDDCTNVESVFECESLGGTYAGLNSNCSLMECFPGSSGACCVGASCFDVSGAADCLGIGTFMGIDTQCSDGPCEADLACCVGAGCIDVEGLSECDDLGGIFLGLGDACDVASCTLVTSPGACCLGVQCFDVPNVAVCTDAGGLYLGLGVPCAVGLCDDTQGVCCFNDNCIRIGEVLGGRECLESGPGYLGPGTACVPGICDIVTGGCCTGEQCTIVADFFECESAGGTFLGLGTTCVNVVCDPGSPGACCLPGPVPGTCVEVPTVDICTLLGGSYVGVDTTCADADFSCLGSSGACCIGDDCIDVGGVTECDDAGGVYLGLGTNCQFLSCDCEIPGACCFDQDTCTDVTKPVSECFLQGGEFQGEGTSCQDTPMPCALLGACCVDDVCSLETSDVCEFSGGQFFGNGSDCVGDPCNQAPSDCLGELVIGVPSEDGDLRGHAVSTDGDLVLIGAMGHDQSPGVPDSGIAYLYRNSTSGTFMLEAPTSGLGQGRSQDRFGCSVSVDGSIRDGIAVVGAYRHDYFPGGPPQVDAGIAYAFYSSLADDSWQAARLILNPEPKNYDYFGYALGAALVNTRAKIVVGAPFADFYGPNSGTAYWIEYDVNEEAEMDWSPISLPGLGDDDHYDDLAAVGHAVSICHSGFKTYAAIGAPGYDHVDGENAGRVCIAIPTTLSGSIGDLSFNVEVLEHPAPHLFKQFGRSVDLYHDEETGRPYVIVGALEREESDSGEHGKGIAFVWEYDLGAQKWSRMWPPLRPNSYPVYNDCGESVSLTRQDGDLYALLGCPGAHWNGLAGTGISVLYRYDEADGRWKEVKRLWACDQTPQDEFGQSVAMDEQVICGAPRAHGSSEGHVYQAGLTGIRSGIGNSPLIFQDVPADIGSPRGGVGHPDGMVDTTDLMMVIELWGPCDYDCDYLPCPGDLDDDCLVGVSDLLIVISSWGS